MVALQEQAVERHSLAPLVRWAGGKRWLAPRIKELYDEHCRRLGRQARLVELFAGGAAVSMHIAPEQVLLNDCNAPLIQFYEELSQQFTRELPELLGEFVQEFELLDPARREAAYYNLRREANYHRLECFCARMGSDRFYLLNRLCFNGLWRENRKGEFNVPYGKLAKPFPFVNFSVYATTMDGWQTSIGDYAAVTVLDGDFVYADPPYDDGFTGYTGAGFTAVNQSTLVEYLTDVVPPGCTIVASNKWTETMVELYLQARFTPHKIAGPRRISCDGNREPVAELLAVAMIGGD